MSDTHPFILAGPSGPLHGLVDLPAAPGPRPAVVICHGFKGFMEWGFFPYLATLLAERGFTTLRFNLWGSGMRPGEDRVSDLAAFRADTHGREIADLLAILEATAGGRLAPGRIDPSRLGLLGHSRGGGAAIVAAARPEWRQRVRALVTWAAVATFDRYSQEQKDAWRRDGFLPVVNSRTGQELRMGRELLDDLEDNADTLDVEQAAGRVTAPWLIVHGEEDETVSVNDARRLERAAREPDRSAASTTELLLVPGASHTFGARHPFVGPTPQLIQAMNATQRWLRRHLAAG